MKARIIRNSRKVAGTAPGTLSPPEDALDSQIRIIVYDEENLEDHNLNAVKDIEPFLKKWPMCWINVNGLGSVDVIQELGNLLNLHLLALEDAVSVPQRAKSDDYGDFIYTVARMAKAEEGSHTLEQLSLFLGKGYVLTFQERPGDVFEPVRERLRKGVGRRIRKAQPDYLAYALLDAVVDGYFPVLENYAERLDKLEEEVLGDPDQTHMQEIHNTKRELQTLRHCIWPMRDAIGKFSSENDLINQETSLFLRDCQDHVIQVLDLLETCRERISGLTDLYLSSISNKMNEVMKVLTIIATIFMPLGFLAGIYGMNFDTSSPYNMPELGMRFAYPVLLGIMILVALGMLVYFRKLGWLGKKG